MIQRIKNLWAWSSIHPYQSLRAMPSEAQPYAQKYQVVTQPKGDASVVDLQAKDPFDIVRDEDVS